MDTGAYCQENTIHKIWAGSRLYGTARHDSDWDLRGVCMLPEQVLLGLTSFEQYRGSKDEDVEIYGLNKFVALALNANPNILDILFAPPDLWLLDTEEWNTIFDNRHLFLSQKARYTFSGYAHSQLKRLEGHHKWLTNPPTHKPEPEEFGGELVNSRKGGQKLIFQSGQKSVFQEGLTAEEAYRLAARHWKQYQTWLKERNPARAKLEAMYGYDTKHASHLARLMLQAINILRECDYNPVLRDIDLGIVLNVLAGKWGYEHLISWSKKIDENIQRMQTDLQKRPARKEVERILIELNRGHL